MPLSQKTQDSGFVEIPGEYTFWKTYGVPPEHVGLPIVVKARIGPLGWLLLFPLAIELAILGSVSFATLIFVDWTNQSPIEVVVVLPALVFTMLFAILIAGMAVRLIADRCAKAPLVEIDQNGLLDRRFAREKITWGHVARAEALYGRSGISAVSLQLRSDAAAVALRRRFDLLRFRPQRPGQCFVEVQFLSVPQRRLALTILALVRANGGEIGSNLPEEGDPLRPRL